MKADVIAMTVVGVRVELPSNTPIVLLREQEGNRYLPIWIGAPEATAIATAMESVEPPRPRSSDAGDRETGCHRLPGGGL